MRVGCSVDIVPFQQDTLDLFATLVVSLELTTHKQFFRTFPNSFTTCVPLFSLLFDPK